jgi:hypothetical protein
MDIRVIDKAGKTVPAYEVLEALGLGELLRAVHSVPAEDAASSW